MGSVHGGIDDLDSGQWKAEDVNITLTPQFAALTGLQSRAAARKKILNLEQAMRGLTQIDCPLKHHFAPGNYAREILLPAGSLVVGKIHKHAHINVISKGSVTVFTESGSLDLKAPATFVSEVGTKRAVLAHEDTVWTTIHPTDETDLEKIEEHVIAKTYDALERDKMRIEQ